MSVRFLWTGPCRGGAAVIWAASSGLDQNDVKAIVLLGPSLLSDNSSRQDTVENAASMTMPRFVGMSGADGEYAPNAGQVTVHNGYSGRLGPNPHYRLAVDNEVTSDVIDFLEKELP